MPALIDERLDEMHLVDDHGEDICDGRTCNMCGEFLGESDGHDVCEACKSRCCAECGVDIEVGLRKFKGDYYCDECYIFLLEDMGYKLTRSLKGFADFSYKQAAVLKEVAALISGCNDSETLGKSRMMVETVSGDVERMAEYYAKRARVAKSMLE